MNGAKGAMNHWNEPRIKERVCLVEMSRDRRFLSCMLYPDEAIPVYEIYAKRWDKSELPTSWVIAPEGWVELWPHEPLLAETFPEARRLQHSLIETLEGGFDRDDFDARLPRLEKIEEITHAAKPVRALILRHQDGPYEVQYLIEKSCGHWVHDRYDVCTFANDLEDARDAAKSEMMQLAASLPKRNANSG